LPSNARLRQDDFGRLRVEVEEDTSLTAAKSTEELLDLAFERAFALAVVGTLAQHDAFGEAAKRLSHDTSERHLDSRGLVARVSVSYATEAHGAVTSPT